MGQDKALLPLMDKPLIEHVVDRLQGLGTDFLITSNNPEPLAYLGIRLVQDLVPGTGPLNGLLTALEAARGDPVLAAACDMPFVNADLFRYMLDRAHDFDVVVPYRAGYYEPMHAVYAKTCIPAVQQSLARKAKRLTSFFSEVRVLLISDPVLAGFDPWGINFFNINTPQDLAEAERFLAAAN
ncbi:MAG: molybdenum cofactor guanylyltransferase [Anaerolineales bacterium]|nr:molybdenum cofactor guanylyltransferase [Anaerolineales bacterium]